MPTVRFTGRSVFYRRFSSIAGIAAAMACNILFIVEKALDIPLAFVYNSQAIEICPVRLVA